MKLRIIDERKGFLDSWQGTIENLKPAMNSLEFNHPFSELLRKLMLQDAEGRIIRVKDDIKKIFSAQDNLVLLCNFLPVFGADFKSNFEYRHQCQLYVAHDQIDRTSFQVIVVENEKALLESSRR